MWVTCECVVDVVLRMSMYNVTVYSERERERERERGRCLSCNRPLAKPGSKRLLSLYLIFVILSSCSLSVAVVFPIFGFSTLTSCVHFHFCFLCLIGRLGCGRVERNESYIPVTYYLIGTWQGVLFIIVHHTWHDIGFLTLFKEFRLLCYIPN